jgi:hypothetical protein
MRLSRDEESFLRHWMYDELHYQEGVGSAKRLQVEHGAIPADLAVLIAAAIPDPAEQEAAGFDPPPAQPPTWPWPGDALERRLAEARVSVGNLSASPGSDILPIPAPQPGPNQGVKAQTTNSPSDGTYSGQDEPAFGGQPRPDSAISANKVIL